jgi:hypothetical protein
MSRAPEPCDIYWQNLHLKFRGKFFRIAITWIATSSLLAASFFIVFFLSRWKVKIIKFININLETY